MSAASKYTLIVGDGKLEGSDPSESNLDIEEVASPSPMLLTRPRRLVNWFCISQLFTLSISIVLFAAATVRHKESQKCYGSIEPAWSQEFGPAVRAVGQRHGVQLKGAFDQPSQWRGKPSPELDDAWNIITHDISGVFSVTAEEIERIGKMDNSTVILPESSGGGYMASMEAIHQLHCLDMLRKYSYKEHYADKSMPFRHPEKLRIHMDHCIEMLRQNIMCNGDLHIITYNWVDHVDYPWPDFSINRQCRNWGSILDWVDGRLVRTFNKNGELIKPDGTATKHVRPVEYVHINS